MHVHYRSLSFLLSLAVVLVAGPAFAQPGTVLGHQKINNVEGGFSGNLDEEDYFGYSVASLGDLNGDGISDLAVGASGDDDGIENAGAVWVLFMNADGTVNAHQKISNTEGGFTGTLASRGEFGRSLASIGDLNGDGVTDLAVGQIYGSDLFGAVWILFLNADGTVNAHQKISTTEGGFTGSLDLFDNFGWSVTALGDLNGDGVPDLAVGARGDDDGGDGRGAVWILFLNADGTVNGHQKISSTEGGFTGTLADSDEFGSSVAALVDLNGDGVSDLAVGATRDNDGGNNSGAAWILFLSADGTVNAHQKISNTEGGFTGTLDGGDRFGGSLSPSADINGDGVLDLVVGASLDDDGGTNRGAVWILFLNSDGTVSGYQKISDTEGGFTGTLDDSDFFGTAVTTLGDLDGNGVTDLAIGAIFDESGSFPDWNFGAVWVLFLSDEDTTSTEGDLSTRLAFDVGAPFPNPFQDGTTIAYTLSEAGAVRVEVYDVLGRRVRTLVKDFQAAGPHTAHFDGADLPSGVYTVRVQHQGAVQTERITLLR